MCVCPLPNCGVVIRWVWTHPEEGSLGSWRDFWMYLSLYNGIFCSVLFLGLNVLNVTLYNGIKVLLKCSSHRGLNLLRFCACGHVAGADH